VDGVVESKIDIEKRVWFMDTRELFDLTVWLSEHGRPAQESFQQLSNALKHNATQPQKQPIKAPLEELVTVLRSLPVEQLSNEQFEMLGHLGIQQFLSHRGAKFVEETIKASEYDPANVASEIQNATQVIADVLAQMDQVQSSFTQIRIGSEETIGTIDSVVIRIQFKDFASIEDVANWKKWSNEWYDIVRGVALCVNEAPENIRVVGASKGSIIMILAGSIPFTKALSIIAKHLSFITKEILENRKAMEDLRHKKIMNKAIEAEFTKQIETLKDNGVTNILAEAKKEIGGKIVGDKENALTKAIEKYLNFSEKGGEVDFVEPPENFADGNGDEAVETQAIADIRESILEIRSLREDVKLLQNHMGEVEKDGEDD